MTSIPAYDRGDKIRLGNQAGDNEDGSERTAFTTIEGTPADPTSVLLEIMLPDNTYVSYAWPTQGSASGMLTREAPGRFFRDIALDEAGLWAWALSGEGTVETGETGHFYVRRSVLE